MAWELWGERNGPASAQQGVLGKASKTKVVRTAVLLCDTARSDTLLLGQMAHQSTSWLAQRICVACGCRACHGVEFGAGIVIKEFDSEGRAPGGGPAPPLEPINLCAVTSNSSFR
jgi:hypothetical protein